MSWFFKTPCTASMGPPQLVGRIGPKTGFPQPRRGESLCMRAQGQAGCQPGGIVGGTKAASPPVGGLDPRRVLTLGEFLVGALVEIDRVTLAVGGPFNSFFLNLA